jgi:hemoglobin/transferrin/lactoferrin receptor protein
VNGTRNKADDIRTPEGILPNSQFTANNIGLKAGFKPFANHLFTLQYQNNWALDVGIPGGAAFPGPAVASYTRISRHLSSATYEITPLQGRLTSLKMNYFTQYIQRDVSMVPNTFTETKLPSGIQRVTPTLVVPIGNHLTHGGQVQSQWKTGPGSNLIAGLDIWSRTIRTLRTKYIRSEILNASGEVVKTNKLERGETPIPESMFGSAGLFAEEEFRLLSDRLTLLAGGRVDGICVRNEKGYDIDYLTVNGVRNDTPPNQRITFSEGHRHSLSWSANTGFLYKVTGSSDLTLNLARSFRAPSPEERFKYIDLGNFVSLGDPGLRPEKGYATDIGWRIWKPEFSLQINGFANRIADLITETPGEFIYTLNTGPSEGTTDTIPAFINANISNALLYGADFSVQYNVWSDLVLFASGAFVRGKEADADTDLPRIPPLNGRVGARYTIPRIGMAEITMVNAAKQTHISAGEKETEGYSRFDLALQSSRIKLYGIDLQLFAGIDNLTDRSYTNHLSTNRGGISVEPGRNYYFRMKLGF